MGVMDFVDLTGFTPAQREAVLQGPGLPPPLGITSNFDHPDTLSIYVVPTIVLCIGFSTLALLMRVYTQRAIARPLYWEDYTAIVAWAMFVGFCVPNVICARHGGAHQWNTRLEEVFLMLYWSNLVQILYGPCILAVKLSILLQYLRIFVPSRQSNKPMFIALSITFTAHLLFYTVDTFFQIFSCNPREKAWDRTIIHGRCFDLPATFVASGAVNVVSDFVLLVLPIYSVWCLKISTRQKIAISGVFATGFLVCVASIGRMIYIIILFRTKNQTRAIIPPGLCGLAEISLALICSCLPTFPMFYRVVRSQLSSLSLFGFRPFHNTRSSPTTINGTKVSRAEGKQQSVWAQSVLRTCDREERWRKEGGEGTYHELGDWQRTPRRGELVVTISSPGRARDGDVKSCFSGLEGSERGMGIVQTVSVEIEEVEAREGWEKRERSFYDSS